MKLASLASGRDGRLCLVSRDLRRALDVTQLVATLQAALDDWPAVEPELARRAEALERDGLADSFALDPARLAAPLPRAYQWVDGSAYVNHVELVRRARGAELPESFWSDPLVYQGGSDVLLGPRDDLLLVDPAWGLDFEAEVAVVTGDVPAGASPETAGQQVRLLMLVNDVSLRGLVPAELAKGFGFYQSKPPSAFSPVAVTPEELDPYWDGAKLSLPLRVSLNGVLFGEPDAGIDMTFDFPTLIAHAARTRRLGAGTIVGSGTVSNRDRSKGSCCLAERRMLETLQLGEPKTPFLAVDDVVRIEMLDRDGASIFGAIEQRVVSAAELRP